MSLLLLGILLFAAGSGILAYVNHDAKKNNLPHPSSQQSSVNSWDEEEDLAELDEGFPLNITPELNTEPTKNYPMQIWRM